MELRRRQIRESVMCPWCESEEETVDHALLHCPSVMEIWSKCTARGPALNIGMSWEGAMVEWKSRGNEESLALAFTLAWYIWGRRNIKIF